MAWAAPLASLEETNLPSFLQTIACGSRGGPGVRGANGKCLSWRQLGYAGIRYRGGTSSGRYVPNIAVRSYGHTAGSMVPFVQSHTSAKRDGVEKFRINGLVLEIRQGTPPELRWDNRVIVSGAGSTRFHLHSLYHHNSKTFVLVHESTGGNACPGFFYVVEVSGSMGAASKSFGTCSDLPDVTLSRDGLHIKLPDYRGGYAVYRYLSGSGTIQELR